MHECVHHFDVDAGKGGTIFIYLYILYTVYYSTLHCLADIFIS